MEIKVSRILRVVLKRVRFIEHFEVSDSPLGGERQVHRKGKVARPGGRQHRNQCAAGVITNCGLVNHQLFVLRFPYTIGGSHFGALADGKELIHHRVCKGHRELLQRLPGAERVCRISKIQRFDVSSKT